MDNRSLMMAVYGLLSSDEILLRLLKYNAENQLDSPLDENKPNVLDMPILKKQEFIDKAIMPVDNHLALDLNNNINRVNFYLGNRDSIKKYSVGAKAMISNQLLSRQEIVFDVHANLDDNRVDFRLNWITDRLRYVLYNSKVRQLTNMKFADGGRISSHAKNFVAYRLIFYVTTFESPDCSSW